MPLNSFQKNVSNNIKTRLHFFNKTKRMKKSVLFICAVLFASAALHAQKSPVFITGTTAISGYDVVAYFTEHMPIKGSKEFSFDWNSATWFFSRRDHLDSFKTNPRRFAPQFGGYCAFGMADGHKAPTDPFAWTIVDDKLYLNYNKEVQGMWKEKQAEYIQTAEKNWPILKDEE